jgi:hypothetical protein
MGEEDQKRYIKIMKIGIIFADAWRHLVRRHFTYISHIISG